MAEDKTFTKDELDAAVTAAVEKATGDVDGLKAKVDEVIGENKKLKADLRKTQDIKPEDVAALEHQVEELTAKLTAAEKAAKDATTAAEKATKALETEQGAARGYAIDAELASAMTELRVVPELAEGFKSWKRGDLKAEVVDGKYVVTSKDGKPLGEYFKTSLTADQAKYWTIAPTNSGGDSRGGENKGGGGKTATRAAFDAMDQGARSAFSKEGGTVVDA